MEEYDVIVIGAGPAGSMAADAIAKAGLSVLVLEKDSIGREKPCGGFISKRTIHEYSIPEDVIDRRCKGLFLCSPSNETALLKADFAGGLVMRSKFDKMLIERAQRNGAVIEERTNVIEPLISGGKIVGVKAKKNSAVQEYKSKLVIAADGTPSTFARKLSLYTPNLSFQGMTASYLMELPKDEIENLTESCIEIYFGYPKGTDGYAWIFPRGDVLSVGLGSTLKSSTLLRLNLGKALREFVTQHPIAKTKLKDAKIVSKQAHMIGFPGVLKKIYGNGFLVCGDAAGFVEYATAEGIYYSMVSGTYAGNTAVRAITAGDPSEHFLKLFAKEVYKKIGTDLKYGVIVRKMLFNDNKKQEALIRLARTEPNFAKFLSDFMFEDTPPTKTIKHILTSPRLIFNLSRLCIP